MIKKLAVIMALTTILMVSLPFGAAIATNKGAIPGIDIVSVVPGQVVTIETSNFPANLEFDVIIGPYGKFGLTGYKVATTNSGSGGKFTATYNIPPDYKNAARLAIRLSNPTKGYFAYNWFENVVPPPAPVTPAATKIPGYKGLPSFLIKEVVKDKSVTVESKNFPPNADLIVTMNVINPSSKGGFTAGSVISDDKGKFLTTIDIPTELAGAYILTIRIQDPASGYYGYNWFFNLTFPVVQAVTPTAGLTAAAPTKPSYEGFPQLEINSVEKGVKVTIQASNLPKNENFDVYIGSIKEMVGGGAKVAKIESGDSGQATATIDIPVELANLWQISIRIVSPSTGYYSYNWFYNQTYP